MRPSRSLNLLRLENDSGLRDQGWLEFCAVNGQPLVHCNRQTQGEPVLNFDCEARDHFWEDRCFKLPTPYLHRLALGFALVQHRVELDLQKAFIIALLEHGRHRVEAIACALVGRLGPIHRRALSRRLPVGVVLEGHFNADDASAIGVETAQASLR